MALKENYKDDILDVSVNTKRKYRMTENADGTISLEDETVYTQEGDSFGASDINATNVKVNTIDSAVTTLNANLDGFKYYPTGTGIVGLIADDSPYKDANDKYVIWGTATANQLVADNPNTYKSVPSTEDCRGEAGADTGTPFSKGFELVPKVTRVNTTNWMYYGTSVALDTDKEYCVISVGNGSDGNNAKSPVSYVSISGNYTTLVKDAFSHSQYFYGAVLTWLIKKEKGDNVTVNFNRGFGEKNSMCAIVTEF